MADEPEVTETTEAPAAGGGARKGLLTLVGGIAGGAGLGTAVGLLVLGPRLAPRSAAAQAPAHAKAKASAPAVSATSPIYMIDNLVLNPAGSGGTRFLLLSVALQVKDDAASAQLKARDAELRDAILSFFGEKTVSEVSEASARDTLRTQVLALIDRLVPPGTVRTVFFPQFVIQ